MALAKEFYVKNFIFSSSATVYGDPQHLPIDEDHRIRAAARTERRRLAAIQSVHEQTDEAISNSALKIRSHFMQIGFVDSYHHRLLQ